MKGFKILRYSKWRLVFRVVDRWITVYPNRVPFSYTHHFRTSCLYSFRMHEYVPKVPGDQITIIPRHFGVEISHRIISSSLGPLYPDLEYKVHITVSRETKFSES